MADQRLTRRRLLRQMRICLVLFYVAGIFGLIILNNIQRVVLAVGLVLIAALDTFLITTISRRLPSDE